MTLNTVWQINLADIRRRLDEEGPGEFLTWPSVHSGMFVGDAPHVRPRFEYLMEHDRDFWEPVLSEPGIGNPPRLSYAPWTSGQLVNQAFHICQWMDKTGRGVANLKSIFEFGAGYGAMALICQRLGFTGQYTILDLDEPMELQRYYLGELGIDFEHIELYEYVECDLFISVCALSEVSWEIKETVLLDTLFGNNCDKLIVFQHLWNGFDNKEYFSRWLDVFKRPLCRHWYGVR
jgi:hypothetical protein